LGSRGYGQQYIYNFRICWRTLIEHKIVLKLMKYFWLRE
jgi:hypothetical protein